MCQRVFIGSSIGIIIRARNKLDYRSQSITFRSGTYNHTIAVLMYG